MYKNELIYIAGWIRESKAGDKYISISIDDRNNTQSQNNSNYPNKPHEEKKDDFLDLLNM